MKQVLFRMDKNDKKEMQIRIINLGFPSIQDYLTSLIKLDLEKDILKPFS